MATQDKVYAGTSDPGFADEGLVTQITYAYQAGESFKFTDTTKSTSLFTEGARRAAAGETWEDWGVPAGGTVTSVQITAWSKRLVSNTKLTALAVRMRLVGSGGATIHSAGELVSASLSTSTDATFQSQGAGTSRAVDSGSQASGTDVRLEIEVDITTSTSGGGASVDIRFNAITITITYDPPSGPQTTDLSDTATLSGVLAKQPARTSAETAALAATLLKMPLRTATEAAAVAEVLARLIAQTHGETVISAETLTRALTRALTSTVTPGESLTATPIPILTSLGLDGGPWTYDPVPPAATGGGQTFTADLSDSVTAAETLARQAQGMRAEGVTGGELRTLQGQKALAEALVAGESFATAILRTRQASESVTTQEILTRQVIRLYAEATGTTETAVRRALKALADLVSTPTETLEFVGVRTLTLSDSQPIQEQAARQVQRIRAEVQGVTEAQAREVRRGLQEIEALAEVLSLTAVQRVMLAEDQVLSEAEQREVRKATLEILGLTEARQFQMARRIAEALVVSEALQLDRAWAQSEIETLEESLAMQFIPFAGVRLYSRALRVAGADRRHLFVAGADRRHLSVAGADRRGLTVRA